MCGFIVEVCANESKHVPSRINEEAKRILSSRGPDDSGSIEVVLSNSIIRLYHVRLAITDLTSLASQPMKRFGITLVFNGEIYNYLELRDCLIDIGVEFYSKSDTEVLCAGLKFFGHDFLNRIDGVFSLFYVDVEREAWGAARDGYGVKPFYQYSESDGYWAYSSDCRSLAAMLQLEFNYQAVMLEVLTLGYLGGLRTPYKHITKVPRGTHYVNANSEEAISTFDCSVTAFENQDDYERAVLLQVPDEVSWGLLLSGGVDSSMLALIASQAKHSPPMYFVDFDDPTKGQEKQNILQLKAQGMDIRAIPFNRVEMERSYNQALSALHAPELDTAIYPQMAVARQARKDGLKVLWSGAGGDEILDAYPRYRSRIRRVINKLRFNSVFERRVRANIHLSRILYPFVDMRFSSIGHGISTLDKTERECLLDILWTDRDQVNQLNFSTNSSYSNADLNDYLPNLLLAETDQIGMGMGIEMRVPLLNKYSKAVAARNSQIRSQLGNKQVFVDRISQSVRGRLNFGAKHGFGVNGQFDIAQISMDSLKKLSSYDALPSGFKGRKLKGNQLWSAYTALYWFELN